VESFLTEASDDDGEGTSGSKTAHRGNLNELSFVHASELYAHSRKKGFSHEESIARTLKKGHFQPSKIETKNPLGRSETSVSSDYVEKHNSAVKSLGKEDAERTLKDSHFAAVAAIDHIHKEHGEITGPAHWVGGDVSGKTVAKITGGKSTQADVVFGVRDRNDGSKKQINIKMGHVGGSLKYGQGDSKNTKLFQGKADAVNELIQKHHVENFGARHAGLDSATSQLNDAFGGVHERLAKHASYLESVLGKRNKTTGNHTGDQLKKLRYASEALGGDKLKDKKIRDHLKSINIPTADHDAHIGKMADIHNREVNEPKREAAKNFNTQLGRALNKSFNEAPSGQNQLVRALGNIRERRQNSNTLIFKTQRGKGNNNPTVKVANHTNVFEALYAKARRKAKRERTGSGGLEVERNMYKAKISDNGNVAVHNTVEPSHPKMFGFGVDTSKGTPSVIVQAGAGIDGKDRKIA